MNPGRRRGRGHVTAAVEQEIECGFVRPVEVFHNHEKRALPRELGEELANGMKQPPPFLLGVERVAGSDYGIAGRDFRDKLDDFGAELGQKRLHIGRRRIEKATQQV
jgi:hypothetical protein